MSDESKQSNKKDGKRNGEFKVPPRTYLLWIAIVLAIPLLMIFRNNSGTQAEVLTQTQFVEKVDSNLISKGTIIYDPQSAWLHEIRGKYIRTDSTGQQVLDGSGKPVEVAFSAKARLPEKLEEKLLDSGIVELVTTDTCPLSSPVRNVPRVRVLPVAPLFAEAIRRIHEGESVGALFNPPGLQLPLQVR